MLELLQLKKGTEKYTELRPKKIRLSSFKGSKIVTEKNAKRSTPYRPSILEQFPSMLS